MMALANMLEHEIIHNDVMGTPIADRMIKRSNKDLGRVLSIAALSSDSGMTQWPDEWVNALKNLFPENWRNFAKRAGDGIKQLLEEIHTPDLEEAHYASINGLLATKPLTVKQYRNIGLRLAQDCIEPLTKRAIDG